MTQTLGLSYGPWVTEAGHFFSGSTFYCSNPEISIVFSSMSVILSSVPSLLLLSLFFELFILVIVFFESKISIWFFFVSSISFLKLSTSVFPFVSSTITIAR